MYENSLGTKFHQNYEENKLKLKRGEYKFYQKLIFLSHQTIKTRPFSNVKKSRENCQIYIYIYMPTYF